MGAVRSQDSILGNKKLIVKKLIVDLCRDKLPDKEPNNRQPPKHPIKNYPTLIIVKHWIQYQIPRIV